MNNKHWIELLEANRYVELMREMDETNAVDAAEFLESLEPSLQPKLFRLLKKDTASEIFTELEADAQEAIIHSMSDREVARFMDDLFIDDAVDMLEELPASVVNRILRNTTPEPRREINRFLNYPEDSVGSIMTSEFVSIRAHMTVQEAVSYIRKHGVDKETVYTIYVTDSARVLRGTVSLRDLLFSEDNDLVEAIMETAVISIATSEDREEAANLISKYNLLALPVVDSESRLVGIVTVDDAVDVIQEETTEDIELMAAISPTDKPYLKTGVLRTWLHRIPWLLFLMLSATFTGTIITHYENALGQMVILTAFIPMLMATGGNAGGQTSATILRSLSLGEIEPRSIGRVLWKELRVALLCGVTLAVVCFFKVLLIDTPDPLVALVVSLTLILAVLVAKLVGCALPILAKCIKLDPAVMASPFISTIVDTVALIIYFNIATNLLGL